MPKTKTDVLERVAALAFNLWWTWNHEAQRLFAAMDPALWEATNHNPLKTLLSLAPERAAALRADADFEAHVSRVETQIDAYLKTPTWFQRKHGKRQRTLVAYFCAEFAIHESLPQYSGGLGVLAGDHVKSASDLGVPFVGVGLLYRNGFYTQDFAPDGSTRVLYPDIDFDECPILPTDKIIDVPMGRSTIKAKIWRQQVGRVSLCLLDTNLLANSAKDRDLTRHLYGGDREYRIRQEVLLGVGGVIALDALGLKPTVYHLNEGHAAFCALERLARFAKQGASLAKAKLKVQQSTVFTTHTPVPAGNDRFDPKLTLKYIAHYADKLGISTHDLLALGREDESNTKEEFCMTVIALKLANHRNGVAALHGDTARKMWQRVFARESNPPAPLPVLRERRGEGSAQTTLHENLTSTDVNDVPITHITNGVHSQTWLPEEAIPLFDKYLKPTWLGAGPDQDWWKNAARIPDAELWQLQQTLRSKLVCFARERLMQHLTRRHAPLQERIAARTVLSPHALTIGFARRFATYKRGHLIFHDPKRLSRILNNAKQPVQLIFAGKAHPQDAGGQQVAQQIFAYARRPEFFDRVILLPDYDMHLGRALTSGVDVWLNNPLRPQEASGTSGMKPPLHGGLNCSIPDGWWPEAFNTKNGWQITDGREFKSRSKQDAYDAAALYDLLENQIIPLFYARDKQGLPRRWIAMMKNSLATVGATFNTHRMVGEYTDRFYLPASAPTRRPRDRLSV